MGENKSKFFYSYEQMLEDISSNLPWIESENFDVVVGLARGGLVPAVCISHALNKPLKIVEYSSKYGHGSKEKENVLPTWLSEGKFLIVDDIADSGNTLKEIMRVAQKSMAFVLTYKEKSCYNAHYVGTYVSNTDWVVFPWENLLGGQK